MWLSERVAAQAAAEEEAGAAVVSVGGLSPAVVRDGERRQARIFSPGGYCWRPRNGETVLVVGGETCVAGREQVCPVALAAGEVYIFSPGASIYLKQSGDIILKGNVKIDGTLALNGVSVLPLG